MKTKYKVGDVLTTRVGKIFSIIGIVEVISHTISGVPKGITFSYKLKGHYYEHLPVVYVDDANHLFLASEMGQLLYGPEKI